MMRVLFIDTVHPVLQQRLEAAGFECVGGYDLGYEDACREIAAFDGIVVRSRIPIDAGLIHAAGRLKFIARSGAGLENIDLEAAASADVRVYNSPEGNRDAVGEHAIGMLLMLFNKLNTADEEVRNGLWRREENRGVELAGKTVGIIGFGAMGSAFAKKLSGFDCRLIAYDKYKTRYAPPYVEEVTLNRLKNEADIISLHLPQSKETNQYIDDAFIASCNRSFYLINTGRGKHVSTEALLKGLESGKVAGACLDVLEFEKKSFEKLSFDDLPDAFRRLLKSKKVVFSPHVAGWTDASYVKLSTFLADKILADFAGHTDRIAKPV